MLKDTTAVVQQALNQGKTLEQMKQERILALWERFSSSFISTDVFLETLYNSLTDHKNNKSVKHN